MELAFTRSRRGRFPWLIILCLLVAPKTALAQSDDSDVCSIETPERIVAVGDIHGAYDQFVSILRAANLVNRRANWIGERAVLVQTGDVLDRGPESRRILDLLRRLEEQASRDGGQVHALLGNHEVARLLGDLRYVSKEEYEEFRTSRSKEIRERYYALLLQNAKERAEADAQSDAQEDPQPDPQSDAEPFDEGAFRERFLEQTPLGFVEMQLAFLPDGEYGAWIRGHHTMVTINGIVFLHGGIHPSVAPLGCQTVNATVRDELETRPWVGNPEQEQTALSVGPDGPLWYRGLAQDDESTLAPIVDGILETLGARAIVMGHTVTDTRDVMTRLNGRLFFLDSGMLGGDYYPGGRPVALEIQGDAVSVIYEDRREALSGIPTDPVGATP